MEGGEAERADAAPSARASAGDPWIGRTIDGRYRVVRRIGEGGMGIVFEAEHAHLGKRVALKIVSPELLETPEIAKRFTREARATAHIEHPHVAAGFDYGLLPEGGAFLVAQLVRGTSLGDRMAGGPMAWPDACAIAAQIADALSAVHRAGFVHRDLTPQNVLLAEGEDGAPHAYLLDFGVAAIVAASPARITPLTGAGMVVGTPGYMSPEQICGGTLEPRSDLYVLGILLWEMLSGRPLFDPDAPLTAVVTTQLEDALELFPIAGVRDAIPEALEQLVRSLLASEVAARPASARAVRATLSEIVAARAARTDAVLVIQAPPPSSLEVLEARVGELRERLDATARSPSGRWAVRIGAALGLCATIAVAIAMLGPDAEPPAAAAAPSAPVSVPDPEPVPDPAPVPDPIAVSVPAAVSVPVPDPAPVSDPVAVSVPAAVSVPDPAPDPDAVPDPAPAPVPVSVSLLVSAMLSSPLHHAREDAARALLARDADDVPAYAREVATLTLANTCPRRERALRRIAALGDPRALPAIERLRDAPDTGCGEFAELDCYACIRDDVAPLIRALRAAAR